MPRLLVITVLLACLTGACASSRVVTDDGVVQATSRHSLSRNVVYVRVAGGAPDAVLLAEPDTWADVVTLLEFGQCLSVLDHEQDYLRVRTTGMGIDFEGWVWAPAVSRVPPREYPPGEEEWEDQGARYDLDSGRIRSEPVTTGDPYAVSPHARPPETERGLRRVSGHETRLRDISGDSEQLRRRYRDFGEQGGLTGD